MLHVIVHSNDKTNNNCAVCCAGAIKKKFQACPTSHGLGASSSLTQIEETPILWSLILVKESGGISLDTYSQYLVLLFYVSPE